MKIRFDPTSIHQSRSGMITGVAYVTNGGDATCFPCERWNDFVVVIACWWLEAANRLKAGERSIRLQFMDGPYWIDVVEEESRSLRFECIDDHTPRTCVAKVDYDSIGFHREVTNFAKSVWQSCNDRRLESDDVRELGRLLGLVP